MKKIGIITDCTCDLTKEMYEKYNIEVLPLYVVMKGKTYQDGIDITTEEMYKLVDKYNELPKTSNVSPAKFEEFFKYYLEKYESIIYYGIGSDLSGTYQNAKIAASEFDENKVSEHVVKYYGVDQFKQKYANDPQLELINKVSSTFLGFTDAELSYTSSDNEILYFETNENKTVMHTKNAGTVVITIKCEYAGKAYEQTVEITVEQSVEVEGSTVKAAIEAADDTNVTVKGVVVSSLVNQTGFYIGDETGIIAVTCDADVLSELKLGNLIVIEGTRIHKKKDPAGAYAGQSVITDAKVIANYYGTHNYSTSFFVLLSSRALRTG